MHRHWLDLPFCVLSVCLSVRLLAHTKPAGVWLGFGNLEFTSDACR